VAITRFKPEIWTAILLSSLKKNHVFAQPNVVNRDYEGEIKQVGDTVKITSISRPTIGKYTENSTTLSYETLTDAQRNLKITEANYFAFQLDDVDAVQAKGSVMPEALNEATFGLRDEVDQYIAGLYTDVPAANKVAAGAAVACTAGDPTAVYDDVLVELAVKLDEANVPSDGRWVALAPWMHGRLMKDDRFIDASKSGNTMALRSGYVGDACGFSILKSNNVPLVETDNYSVLAGHRMAISFAEQINDVEAFRSQESFADRMRGLHTWGCKVIRPEALAYALVSQT